MDRFDRPEYMAHVSTKGGAITSPGPAAYDTSQPMLHATSVIKIGRRPRAPPPKDTTPFYMVPSSYGKVPKICMRGRTDLKPNTVTPGPTYQCPALGRDARKNSFGGPKQGQLQTNKAGQTEYPHPKNPAITLGPGPGTYDISGNLMSKGKGIQMKGNHDYEMSHSESPGPAAYKPNYEVTLPTAPKPTFHIRPTEKSHSNQADFRALPSTLGGVGWTMKRRAYDDILII
uniref:Uncharacterized protein n=1 Tax=Coptotermes formosanus TaxID=36987 RepID=R4UW28_COPFO|nr:hypothetical protein [Coptotermes formosanus]